MPKQLRPEFSRGYNAVRVKVKKNSRFTMSCYNCDFFYQAEGDDHEMCQNPDVLKYDMVITENGVYCNRWVLFVRETSALDVVKKGSVRTKHGARKQELATKPKARRSSDS